MNGYSKKKIEEEISQKGIKEGHFITIFLSNGSYTFDFRERHIKENGIIGIEYKNIERLRRVRCPS